MGTWLKVPVAICVHFVNFWLMIELAWKQHQVCGSSHDLDSLLTQPRSLCKHMDRLRHLAIGFLKY
jgi:hypothetical protein